MITMDNQCPGCGAHVPGGREGCQALWHELVFAGGLLPGAAFDAYCMQHLDQYCVSAKSYAAHLTRLCCGLEYDGNPHVYRAIQQWLNGNRRLEKPDMLPIFGSMTIADIRAAPPEARARVAQSWVENVWSAYAPQHELARSWIELALGE